MYRHEVQALYLPCLLERLRPNVGVLGWYCYLDMVL
jgi:hypothetical protein